MGLLVYFGTGLMSTLSYGFLSELRVTVAG